MKVFSSFEWRQQGRLLAERHRLRALLEDLRSAATSRSDYEPHDVTDDEAAIQADVVEGRLAAIDTGLERIDAGDYGRCQTCGAVIAEARLDALPAAAVCRECAG